LSRRYGTGVEQTQREQPTEQPSRRTTADNHGRPRQLDEDQGTGALGDIGSHIIDVGEYVCGPIQSVSGGTMTTQINQRPLPLGAVVGHDAAPVSEETVRDGYPMRAAGLGGGYAEMFT
jgi:hypothetical protein